MNAAQAADTKPAPGPDPITAFRLRCEQDAKRFAEDEFALADAVDLSWNCAVAFGIDQMIGVDAVQAIMADIFGSARAHHGVAGSTLAAAEWLFFQVKDHARFDAWMMCHSEAERDLITTHLKERKRARAGATSS